MLPNTYDIAISEENYLIPDGKITPRPPTPLFPEAPVIQLIVAPIPTTVILVTPSMTSSNELHKVKAFLQSYSNELVALKRQQAQPNRPYQPFNYNYQQNGPPY